MRVVAIIATYNERRFIQAFLDHYIKHGIEVYILDNESTDNTVDIARPYLAHGLIAIESLPREGFFDLRKQLLKKEEVAQQVKADWFIHADPDEIRVGPSSDATLLEALEEADREGFNAVNFMEFTFVPTIESPDHDRPNFQETMRCYHPFASFYPQRVNAWKNQSGSDDLMRKVRDYFSRRRASSRGHSPIKLEHKAGHRVEFKGLKLYPLDFKMKHYLCLSKEHAREKYCRKVFSEEEVAMGWHGWRTRITEADIRLPSERALRRYVGDDALDPFNPLKEYLIFNPE